MNGCEDLKEYKVSPLYKKSTYEVGYWTKELCNKKVVLLITTVWRWGEFAISIYDKERRLVLEQNPLVINDYSGECLSTTDGCEYIVEIKDLDSYSEEEKEVIFEDVYEDRENEDFYDECTLEEKGWELDETIYEIYGGIVMENEEETTME